MPTMESSVWLRDGFVDIAVAVAQVLIPDFTLAESVELAILDALLQGKPVTPASIAADVAGSWNRRWATAFLAVKVLLAAGHIVRQDGRLAITRRGGERAYQLEVVRASATLFVPAVHVPTPSLCWTGWGS